LAWESLGEVDYGRKSSESGNVKFRRSLYVVHDIKAGQFIESKHIKSIRPGYGLEPKFYEKIIGMKALKDIECGSALSWELIE
jgi:N-acetylneuraminate synthase